MHQHSLAVARASQRTNEREWLRLWQSIISARLVTIESVVQNRVEGTMHVNRCHGLNGARLVCVCVCVSSSSQPLAYHRCTNDRVQKNKDSLESQHSPVTTFFWLLFPGLTFVCLDCWHAWHFLLNTIDWNRLQIHTPPPRVNNE